MLYLIATPIGNLGDITLRALETLKLVDLIAAEDTRHSGNLLRHFEIKKPLLSYHAHNEARRTQELLSRLEAGEKIGVISDAGMPGISDPGHRLLRACIERGIPYTILPGPSAVLTALIGSGFPAEKFHFGGFLPTKSGQRERQLLAANSREETSIFFESPYRLVKSLEVCSAHFPTRPVCVARELTKQFEEFRIGPAPDLLAHYSARTVKGEIVFLISGTD
ncbi:MAG: 16S rRNA (cytidine(1402)-2'-O)-methyltransferase [Verrucomicrobiota bacterium]